MSTRLEAHGKDILHLTIIVGLCTFVIVSDFVDFLTFLKFLYIISLFFFFSKETESNLNVYTGSKYGHDIIYI